MKRMVTVGTLFTAILIVASYAVADEYVRGYTRKDGTYVAPYVRSDRDSSYNNNWSVRGNQNPYTGEEGTKSRTWNDRTPSHNNDTYGNSGYTYGNGNGNRTNRGSRGLYGD